MVGSSSTFRAPIRTFRHLLAGTVLLAVGATAVVATREVVMNGYLALGYHRTILITAGDSVRALVPWAAGFSLLATVAGLALQSSLGRRGHPADASRSFALGTSIGCAALALLALGHTYNRYHADVNWSWMRAWRGLRVPGFLWEWEVLAINAGFVVAAAVTAWGLYRLTWAIGQRAPALRRAVIGALDSRAALALGVAILLLVSMGSSLVRGSGSGRPSVVIVSIDTLRADHLGCYGYERETSPAIDLLARESVLFEWAISQAEATLPSHVSLFTSLLPSTHGVWNRRYVLHRRHVTLAEVFREAGYRTAAFVDAGHMLGIFGFSQGFDVYHDRYERLEGSVGRALAWLDGPGARGPSLLFVHGYDVHTPYSPWSPYREQFTDAAARDSPFEPTVKAMGAIGRVHRSDPGRAVPLSEADRGYIIGCYDAAIRWADDLMARLIDGLAARGRLENTWIVILSDHGEEFLEHGSVEHDKLYHTVTHVPLIVRPADAHPAAPGLRGRRVPSVVSLLDVFPTLCELARIEPPLPLAGRSLMRHLLARSQADAPAPEVAYSQSWRWGHERAITSDSLHAISSMEDPDDVEVYAYRRDPLERSPLYSREAVVEPPEPARELARQLVEWMRSTAGDMDENVARRLFGSDFETLRNLGYIQ